MLVESQALPGPVLGGKVQYPASPGAMPGASGIIRDGPGSALQVLLGHISCNPQPRTMLCGADVEQQ